jgi:Tol biopolymer transport system component
MNADGTGATTLAVGDDPAWSPDGTRIAFIGPGPRDPACSPRGIHCNAGDLHVMNQDGTGDVDLTPTMYADEGLEGGPTWTPDGQWITFTRYDPGAGVYAAFSIRPDGTGEKQLPLPPGAIKAVSWSPDGGRLAYARQAGALPYLFSADPNGTGETRLCCASDFDFATHPDWSPNGQALVFTHGNSPGTLMKVNRDGSGLTILSDNQDDRDNAAWSPDGTKIVFARWNGFAYRLLTMDPNGSDVQQLGNEDAIHPSWQPIVGPQRGDYENAARFCRAERDFLGDAAFENKYGGRANAYGKCVSG